MEQRIHLSMKASDVVTRPGADSFAETFPLFWTAGVLPALEHAVIALCNEVSNAVYKERTYTPTNALTLLCEQIYLHKPQRDM